MSLTGNQSSCELEILKPGTALKEIHLVELSTNELKYFIHHVYQRRWLGEYCRTSG